MARVTPVLSPGQLAARIDALPVNVEGVSVETRDVRLPDYPGEPRPSGTVKLWGFGHEGRGENVAFTAIEQQDFVSVAARWFGAHEGDRQQDVGSARRGLMGTPYERAALEAALVDLALRQSGVRLADLTGVTESPLRYVVSLAAAGDPLAEIARHRELGYHGGFKVDVDPSWSHLVWHALGHDPDVVILDFKRRGDSTTAWIAEETAAHALFEDPPLGFTPSAARVSHDADLFHVTDVAGALTQSASVNLKAPRMGGPLTVLESMELVWQREEPLLAYVGGMFEIGVGRSQARQLAALYCPDGPNDLAPNRIARHGDVRVVESPPATVRFDGPGFG